MEIWNTLTLTLSRASMPTPLGSTLILLHQYFDECDVQNERSQDLFYRLKVIDILDEHQPKRFREWRPLIWKSLLNILLVPLNFLGFYYITWHAFQPIVNPSPDTLLIQNGSLVENWLFLWIQVLECLFLFSCLSLSLGILLQSWLLSEEKRKWVLIEMLRILPLLSNLNTLFYLKLWHPESFRIFVKKSAKGLKGRMKIGFIAFIVCLMLMSPMSFILKLKRLYLFLTSQTLFSNFSLPVHLSLLFLCFQILFSLSDLKPYPLYPWDLLPFVYPQPGTQEEEIEKWKREWQFVLMERYKMYPLSILILSDFETSIWFHL